MNNCTSGCKTQNHESYAQCLRSKHMAVTGLESTGPSFTREANKAWDSELDLYESARKQGIQPATTNRKDIETALKISDKTGTAFDAAETPTLPGLEVA